MADSTFRAMGTKLANRAKMARLRAGFARESDAAKKIGCSRPLVIRWENGEAASIGGKYLLAAARAYKVNPAWLSLETDADGFPWMNTGQALPPPEPLIPRDDPSYAMRPDAAKMASAYSTALIWSGLAGVVLVAADARHMSFVCEIYELIARGEGTLPGEQHASALMASVQRLPQLTGEPTNATPQPQQHRTRRKR